MKKAEVLLWILRICEKMKLSKKVSQIAMELLFSNEDIIKNHKPKTVAGALIHIASKLAGEGRSQVEISREAGISEVSLRNVVKEVNIFKK